MFLGFIDGALGAILVLLAYLSPVLIIGLVICSFVRGREKPASITDWEDSRRK